MGHLTSKDELLRALRVRLDQNPIGLPEAATVYDILGLLFTEEEALVGSRFPLGLTTPEVLAEVTGLPPQRLDQVLQGMMHKGLVVKSEREGQRRYALSMAMIGFFEFTFMRTETNLPLKQLAELMSDFRHTEVFAREFFRPGGTQRTKALLYESVLPQVTSEVLTMDQAAAQVREAGRGSLTMCYCRHEAQHLGRACEMPVHDICISLGRASDFLVEQGFARRAEVPEIIETLHRAEELGLVHIGDNIQEQVTFICNCCGCCCGLLAGFNQAGLKQAVNTTGFLARPDPEECLGCGQCAESCQIYAIEMLEDGDGERPRVKEDLCLGCGVCVHFCPTESMTLVERPRRVMPPKTYKDLLSRLLAEKGRFRE